MALSEKMTNVNVEITVPLIRRKRYLPSFIGKNKYEDRGRDSQFVHLSVHILDDEGVVAEPENGCVYIYHAADTAPRLRLARKEGSSFYY